MSGHKRGKNIGHGGCYGDENGGSSLSTLFSSMTLSIPWSYEPISGFPRHITPSQKGIYSCLENTLGALEDVIDPVEDTESLELEQLISGSIGRRGNMIDGWNQAYWSNFEIVGRPRQSRVNSYSQPLRPVHLRYGISTDQQTYVVKKALVIDESEKMAYPFALSNLIGLTCLRHNVSGNTLRHLIFYNVTNEKAWAAMGNAFMAAGIILPELPREDVREESHPRKTRHSRGRKTEPRKGKGAQMLSTRLSIKAPNDGDYANLHGWNALHNRNPFTAAVHRLGTEETANLPMLPPLAAYTLLAVTQPRQFAASQSYWSALIAHFDWPDRKGKGKEVQASPSAASSSAGGHQIYS